MRKSELLNLMEGTKIQHKRNGQVLTVVAVQEDKIVCEERTISVSNCTRWFDVVEIPEPIQPVQPTIIEEKHEDEKVCVNNPYALKGQQEQTTKTHTTEANTTTPGQQIFENSISGVVIQHGCHLNRMKEYVKVGKEGHRGCLVYIRTARDKSWKFDVSKKTWNKLTSEYQQYLIEQYGASIVDSSRGLWRIANCNELDVFEVLLLTALQIA